MKTFNLLIAFTISLAGCSPTDQPAAESDDASSAIAADTIYINGRIYTVDEAQPWAEAVAIKDGKFVAVGSNDDVASVTGENTDVIDLAGKFAMPGIVDLHVHPWATPTYNTINLEFSNNQSPEQMLTDIKVFADANPDKEWIRGGSWGLGVFPNNSPRKELIDEVVSDRPVILIDQTGHALWLNSLALEMAGIDADTPTDAYYVIDKDPDTGEPTGTIRESAIRLVEQVAEWPTTEEYTEAVGQIFNDYNSFGVTSMQTAEGNKLWLDFTKTMETDGDLSMRLFVGWDWHMHLTTPYSNEEMDEQIANRAIYESDLISPNYVKVFLDGTPDGYTAPFIEPYSDGSGKYGDGKFDLETLTQVISDFDNQGIAMFMHSIGDASTRMALDAIEAVRKQNGDSGIRHQIAHLAFVHADDFARFASIPGVVGEMSPAAPYPMPLHKNYIAMLGDERYQGFLAAKSFMDAGGVLGFGTDWLTLIPPSPWMPMQGFVTRENPEHPELGVLNEAERISIEEAIRMFTYNGAYALMAEDRIGSIEVGKAADFIVLDRNLLEIEPTAIRDTKVQTTVLNGRVVYQGN